MKLKGKLILSCAALAAVATTAFSTTYAWYTSNTEVKATGINASTAAADSSTLQVSKDGSTWGATVDLSDILKNDRIKLTPVERTANDKAVGTYLIQNDSAEPTDDPATTTTVEDTIDPVLAADKEGTASKSANVVQFDLYFRNITLGSDKTCPVYVKTASVTNNKAGSALPASKLLTDIKTYKATEHASYTVDLLRALDLEIVGFQSAAITTDFIDVVTEGTGATAFTGEKVAVYTLESFANAEATKDTLSTITGFDALDYYNTVKNGHATRPTATNKALPTADFSTSFDSKSYSIGTIAAANKVLKTTWTLYLDGWDTACFDACKGQDISMSLTFTTVPTKN